MIIISEVVADITQLSTIRADPGIVRQRELFAVQARCTGNKQYAYVSKIYHKTQHRFTLESLLFIISKTVKNIWVLDLSSEYQQIIG